MIVEFLMAHYKMKVTVVFLLSELHYCMLCIIEYRGVPLEANCNGPEQLEANCNGNIHFRAGPLWPFVTKRVFYY